MNRDDVLKALFPDGWQPRVLEETYFHGRARVGAHSLTVVGTAQRTEIGADLALRMAAAVLDAVRNRPGETILFLLDTQGQRLRRRDEMLGLNGYMAHLAKCVEIARGQGHRVLSVVYGEAVSGGYLTSGMMADACYALADAEIKVMNLPAMARITRIPLERLQALSAHSPVFSPGVDNYYRMGHLRAIWSDDYARRLAEALRALAVLEPAQRRIDQRMQLGQERGGRGLAAEVAQQVRAHA
jgi:malonate decarboxylase gamma subunit